MDDIVWKKNNKSVGRFKWENIKNFLKENDKRCNLVKAKERGSKNQKISKMRILWKMKGSESCYKTLNSKLILQSKIKRKKIYNTLQIKIQNKWKIGKKFMSHWNKITIKLIVETPS